MLEYFHKILHQISTAGISHGFSIYCAISLGVRSSNISVTRILLRRARRKANWALSFRVFFPNMASCHFIMRILLTSRTKSSKSDFLRDNKLCCSRESTILVFCVIRSKKNLVDLDFQSRQPSHDSPTFPLLKSSSPNGSSVIPEF